MESFAELCRNCIINTIACNEVRSRQSAMSSSWREARKYLYLKGVSVDVNSSVSDLPGFDVRLVTGLVEVRAGFREQGSQSQYGIE